MDLKASFEGRRGPFCLLLRLEKLYPGGWFSLHWFLGVLMGRYQPCPLCINVRGESHAMPSFFADFHQFVIRSNIVDHSHDPKKNTSDLGHHLMLLHGFCWKILLEVCDDLQKNTGGRYAHPRKLTKKIRPNMTMEKNTMNEDASPI